MYLQICQGWKNSRYTYTIANESEQIILDSCDRRGQLYLHYTGPGQAESGVAGPRYIRYTGSYYQILYSLYSRIYTNEACCILQYLYHIMLQKH